MGDAQVSARQAQFDLPPVVVAGQGQRDPVGGSLGEDLRAMRQEDRRDAGRDPAQGGRQVRIAGAQVVDSGDSEGALRCLDHPVAVLQQRYAMAAEDGSNLFKIPIPVLVIAKRSKATVAGVDPGHFLHAGRQEQHRVGDVIAGEDEHIRLQRIGLLGITTHLFPGHVNAGMNVGELNDPYPTAERQAKFFDSVSFGCIGGAVAGNQKRRGGEPAYPGSQKSAAAGIHARGDCTAREAVEEPDNQPSQPACNLHNKQQQGAEDRPQAPDGCRVEKAYLGCLRRVQPGDRLEHDAGVYDKEQADGRAHQADSPCFETLGALRAPNRPARAEKKVQLNKHRRDEKGQPERCHSEHHGLVAASFAGGIATPNIDGFVENPISALRFIPQSLRRTLSTPHSAGIARLELGLFTKPSIVMTFYESINVALKYFRIGIMAFLERLFGLFFPSQFQQSLIGGLIPDIPALASRHISPDIDRLIPRLNSNNPALRELTDLFHDGLGVAELEGEAGEHQQLLFAQGCVFSRAGASHHHQHSSGGNPLNPIVYHPFRQFRKPSR